MIDESAPEKSKLLDDEAERLAALLFDLLPASAEGVAEGAPSSTEQSVPEQPSTEPPSTEQASTTLSGLFGPKPEPAPSGDDWLIDLTEDEPRKVRLFPAQAERNSASAAVPSGQGLFSAPRPETSTAPTLALSFDEARAGSKRVSFVPATEVPSDSGRKILLGVLLAATALLTVTLVALALTRGEDASPTPASTLARTELSTDTEAVTTTSAAPASTASSTTAPSTTVTTAAPTTAAPTTAAPVTAAPRRTATTARPATTAAPTTATPTTAAPTTAAPTTAAPTTAAPPTAAPTTAAPTSGVSIWFEEPPDATPAASAPPAAPAESTTAPAEG